MFEQQKASVLRREDKSRKGSIDEPIIPLIEKINSHKDYFTTSSCSGRTIVINRYGRNEKLDSRWLYSEHSLPKYKEIIKAINQDFNGELWLKFEPLIIHIRCRNIYSAKKMLDYARGSGLKNSGIITLSRYPVVQVEGTDKIDTLIGKDKILVDEEYIKVLLSIIKKKFKRNKSKTKRFLNALFND